MKNFSLFLYLLVGFIFISATSCTRINQSTDVGGELIPGVDNVNTFETILDIDPSTYTLFSDTTKFFTTDFAAIGRMNDPVFGITNANLYFNLSLPSSSYGTYPFKTSTPNHPDSLIIDSVILSLSYAGAYGDVSMGSTQTVRVFEISPTSSFRSDTIYKFTDPEFTPNGIELGSKTFHVGALKDTIPLIRRNDTAKVNNVLRIPLTNELGRRFSRYDTTSNPSTGGFRSDSLFRSLFKGIKIQTESFTGLGALSYFDLTDRNKTNLTVYFQAVKNGVKDTTSVTFFHLVNGQANIITRQPGGDYAAHANAGASPDGKLYIQSTPGSYVSMKIPGLNTLGNKVVHRAELIVHRIPSAFEDVFTPPDLLFVDKISNAGDSAYLLQNDVPLGADGSIGFSSFGGILRSDNTYRFNITRHVQGILTRKEPNYTLRLYAPFRAPVWVPGLKVPYNVPVNNVVAKGRVVVGGGNYVNAAQRMRVRIIYSNL